MTGTMREDFEAALESSGIELEDENALQETAQEVLTDDVPEEEELSPIEGGETEDTEKSPSQDQPDVAVSDEASPTDKVAPKADESERSETDSIKAPVNWGPKERESWSKIPRPLQDKIVAREKEMADAMQGTADARKTHGAINQLAQAYAPILAAEGAATPMAAIQSMFQTVAQLRMGSPADKAGQIAQMIKHYGVDIGTLDSMLVGESPQQNPNAQLESLIDQRMAPINNVMEQLSQQQLQFQQNQQQQATQAVVDFGQNAEFLADVRNDMADLIDLAAKHGRELSMQEAYDRACALNPDVSAVIEERARAEKLLGDKTTLANKRKAASSLNGQQQGDGGSRAGMSMRDTIADAWDNAGS